jgi:hypothetical protein
MSRPVIWKARSGSFGNWNEAEARLDLRGLAMHWNEQSNWPVERLSRRAAIPLGHTANAGLPAVQSVSAYRH